MSIYRELAYDRVISQVRGIQFCVLSEQEILRRSVLEVTENQTYQTNEPVLNGLFDTRMGVIDANRVCATCQQRNTFCPGHFGHVRLARPVFYIQFFDIVRKLMKCVCFRCSRVQVDLDGAEARAVLARKMSRQRRWDAMSKLCAKVRRCGQDTLEGCGAKVPDRVVKTDNMTMCLKLVWRDADGATAAAAAAAASTGGGLGGAAAAHPHEVVFTAEDVLRVLRRVTDVECEALGFSSEYARPEWLICTVLPVPPPAVRPSVRKDSGQRQEDDLTHKLVDIIKENRNAARAIERGTSHETIDTLYVPLLQYHVATLIDNSMPSINPAKDRAGRMLRSLTERLRHKEGRIRGNLMGKRVDFSARTVITPDPNLSIDELGVPLRIAMNLTFPDVVCASNRDEMVRLVLAGPDAYPGAKQVRKAAENRTMRLRGHPDIAGVAAALEVGDVVERHLRNGDYVLFNRQPSLHKMSMMAHRVRVMPYNTFRLNVCVCASYNADFDGDEMNMHVPQSLQTHYEIRELAAVPLHVLSPRYSKPIITIVQDVALGVFRITQPHVRVSQRQLFNLACANPMIDPVGGFAPQTPPPGAAGAALSRGVGGVQPTPMWTGRQVLSTVLPPTATYYKEGKDGEEAVVIRGGEILQGVLSHDVFKRESVGLVHATYNTLGPAAVTAMLNSTQKLICDWLVLSGFSVGVSDLAVLPHKAAAVRAAVEDGKLAVGKLLRDVHAGVLENHSTKSNAEFAEDQIIFLLSRVAETSERAILQGAGVANNRMLNMIESGSKGNNVNFRQMTACLGTQSIDGRRAPDGFDHRTLPHFTKYDDGPEARGFVQSSFIDGLTPHEFFFHSMAGRIGLIDTAVRSVAWDTAVVVLERGRARRVRIGEWIDALLRDGAAAVQRFPQDRNLELLELGEGDVLVPTVSADGRTSWGRMTAVTRHDPGERLYRVRTAGGREVVVAESCSLLVWNAATRRLDPTHSPDVRPGDLLPVAASLAAPDAAAADDDDGLPTPHPRPADYASHPSSSEPFQLDHSNGMLVGLYLAVGSADVESGDVRFARSTDFAEAWFEQAGVPVVGPGTGRSRSLASFLVGFTSDSSTGGGFAAPCVPDAAFAAPEDFVRGLLSGYVTAGACTLQPGAVCLTVESARVAEGIAMLCARIGVFAATTAHGAQGEDAGRMVHRVCVRARWAKMLLDAIGMSAVAPALNPRCEALQAQAQAQGQGQGQGQGQAREQEQEQVHDVVLDPVVSVEVLGVQDHPKLYDVTVPSTLNFVLANGLGVRDTSETGYLQRRLVKAMEDCKVHHDLTVRNANGYIVQFLYGEDGMDAVRLEFHELPYLSDASTPAGMRDAYLLVDAEAELGGLLRDDVLRELAPRRDELRARMQRHFEQLLDDRRCVIAGLLNGEKVHAPVVYPVNLLRLVEQAAALEGAGPAGSGAAGPGARQSDLDPLWVLDRIDELAAELAVGAEGRRPGDVHWMPLLLRCFLSPKQLVQRHRLGRRAFEAVLRQARADFRAAVASPGDMTGIVAAMSIGEPCTQLTLNTFHMAGVGSNKVTMGVPRMRELMSVSKNIKTPSMRVCMRREWATRQDKARLVQECIEMTHLRDLVRRSSVHFDPDDAEPAQDAELLRFRRQFDAALLDGAAASSPATKEQCAAAASAPWLLRLEFERARMLDLGVTMLDVEATLLEFYDDTVRCVVSDDGADVLVCRLRLPPAAADSADLLTEIKALEQAIMEHVVVKGMPRVERAVLLPPPTLARYDAVSDAFVASDEWTIETAGSNMAEVLAHPCVDSTRTSSNDVYEVFTVLGIEAARQTLINEMRKVITADLDHRHLSLLGDTMTNRGFFMSIDRHGINNRGELGPLAKCSFEQTTDMLIKAGVFAERDRINGVSANIMLGQVAPCGTGDCTLLLDNERIARAGTPVHIPTAPPTSAAAAADDRQAASAAQAAAAAAAAPQHTAPAFAPPPAFALPAFAPPPPAFAPAAAAAAAQAPAASGGGDMRQQQQQQQQHVSADELLLV